MYNESQAYNLIRCFVDTCKYEDTAGTDYAIYPPIIDNNFKCIKDTCIYNYIQDTKPNYDYESNRISHFSYSFNYDDVNLGNTNILITKQELIIITSNCIFRCDYLKMITYGYEDALFIINIDSSSVIKLQRG